MRTKSPARRQAILDVAAQTFRELGYERTTMCEIRARVGGSKATLYSYFASKEELFFAVIAADVEADVEAIYSRPPSRWRTRWSPSVSGCCSGVYYARGMW